MALFFWERGINMRGFSSFVCLIFVILGEEAMAKGKNLLSSSFLLNKFLDF